MPLLVIGLGACGVEAAPPAVELGTGEIAWQPLADGDTIEVIHGPQGGYHVLASMRSVGVEAGDRDDAAAATNPTVTFKLFHGGVDLTLTSGYRQGLDPVVPEDPPWTHQMIGRLCILDIEDDDVLTDETVELTLTLEDATGATWSDARTLTAIPHPLNL